VISTASRAIYQPFCSPFNTTLLLSIAVHVAAFVAAAVLLPPAPSLPLWAAPATSLRVEITVIPSRVPVADAGAAVVAADAPPSAAIEQEAVPVSQQAAVLTTLADATVVALAVTDAKKQQEPAPAPKPVMAEPAPAAPAPVEAAITAATTAQPNADAEPDAKPQQPPQAVKPDPQALVAKKTPPVVDVLPQAVVAESAPTLASLGGIAAESVSGAADDTGPLQLSEPSYRSAPPPPRYPALSRRRGEQGTVWLRVQIDKTGTASEVRIKQSSGYDRLDAAAVQAVRRWAFEPAALKGVFRAAWVEIPVTFKLRR
tara:strand:- start:23552 stop:24496 length:945 start_codon:yes stop_codon:yes gene_type:complete